MNTNLIAIGARTPRNGLLNSSAHVKVGRAVPSAPREVGVPSVGSGALGTARPTTKGATRFVLRTGVSTGVSALLLLSVLGPLPSARSCIFSGNAGIEISDPTGGLTWNSTNDALTVQCWFKISFPSGVTPSENMTILRNTSFGTQDAPYAYRLWYEKDARNIQFSTQGTNIWQGVLIPSESLCLDRWYHVAVVRSGNSLTNYVDGRYVSSGSGIGDSRSTAGVSIGGSHPFLALLGWSRFLYGEVQEVAIYQKALSQQAIQNRLFKDQTDFEKLVGYYKLGYSANSTNLYRNFALSPPAGTSPATNAGPGQILFEETNQKGEQSLFDSMKNGGKNAVVPLSGAFAWQHSAFSRPTPGVPFDLSIAYSPGASSTLGPGWSHVFNSTAKPVIAGTSDWNIFTWQGGVETWDGASDLGPFSTRHGEYRGELARTTNSEIEWTTPARLTYRYLSQNVQTNDMAIGQLAEIRDLNGNSLQVGWNIREGYITNVVDSAGGNYQFSYDASQRLTSVSYGAWQVLFTYADVLVRGQNQKLLATKILTNTSGLYTNLSTTWRFYYNTNGLLEQIVNPSSNTSLYVEYDEYARRINTINALGDSTRMEYGAPGNRQIRTTDPGGYQWIDTYDRKGRVIAQRDPLGNTTRYAYDEHGNRTAITDPKGNTTHLGYDERGNVIAQTNALGEVTRLTYHPFFNKPLTQTDPTGWVTRYEYDSAGNLTNQFDDLGTLASYTYTTNGLVLTSTDANGHTTTNAYNADGFVIAQTDAAGFTTQFEPNELGWNLKTINPLNEETTYAYDLNGKVVRTVDALGRIFFATNDACGDVLGQIDGKGQWTRYTYDALRRKTGEVDRAGGTSRFAYTPRGKLASATNALGQVTTCRYDNANRQTAVVDPAGNTSTTVYDANGNAVATIDPLGRRWSKVVDRLNRVVAESDPFGNTSETLYDAAGRVRETIAPNGSRTINTYDGRGRLIKWVDAAGSQWQYQYDRVGNITNIIDAKGSQYAMAYGPRNERVLERNQDGREWHYYYDELLRLKTQTEPKGTERNLAYDAGGRLSYVAFNTGRANSLWYDANDNPTNLLRTGSGPPTSSQLDYDPMDRLQSYCDAFGKTTHYDYDLVGRLTTLTYPGSKTLTHAYDALDRLTNQVFQFGVQAFTTSYAYDQAGQLIRRTYPNGIVQTNTFDTCGRLTGLSYSPLAPPPSSLNIALAYAYDRNGNTIRAGEQGTYQWPAPALRNETASYRPSGQLIDRQIQDSSVVSNQSAVISYAYDASGNMTNAAGGGQTWTLTYDEDNRTTSVHWDAGVTSKNITNRYDAFGRRIARRVDGVETRYVLDLAGDMERILCDVTAAGIITAWYVHGPDLAFKVARDGSLTCYHADAQGNIVALTDAAGNTVAEYAYTPYGRCLGSTNSQPATLDSQPFLFVGSQGVMMEERGIPGLYFMRARYYSADAGVFLSTDPVKNIGPTWRPIAYAYANGNPLHYNDPKGEGIGGALFGATVDMAFQLIKNKGDFSKMDWASVAGSALTGAFSVPGGSWVRSAIGYGVAGFFGAGLEQALKGELNRKGLVEAALIGAVAGVFGEGAERGFKSVFKAKTLKNELAEQAAKRFSWKQAWKEGDSLIFKGKLKTWALETAGPGLVRFGAHKVLENEDNAPQAPVSSPSIWHPSSSPVFVGCNCGQ
jgi:RHS repeat-associated protein